MTGKQWATWIAEMFEASIQRPVLELVDIARAHPDRYQRALAKAALAFFADLRRAQEPWCQEDRFVAQVNTLKDVRRHGGRP